MQRGEDGAERYQKLAEAYIEATNPGIDMDEVRRQRKIAGEGGGAVVDRGGSQPPSPLEETPAAAPPTHEFDQTDLYADDPDA